MLFCLVLFYYNALQISENSEGEESWSHGDSDYRRLPGGKLGLGFRFGVWGLGLEFRV